MHPLSKSCKLTKFLMYPQGSSPRRKAKYWYPIYFISSLPATVQSVLFSAVGFAVFPLFAVRPIHVVLPSLRPRSTNDPRPRLFDMPIFPSVVYLTPQEGLDWFEPHSFLQLLIFAHFCHYTSFACPISVCVIFRARIFHTDHAVLTPISTLSNLAR